MDYRALPIKPGDLESAVKSAKAEPWVGWNVTIPHKVNILPLMDSLDASADDIGAVNVVHFRDKAAIGYNTDAEGFITPLRQIGFPVDGCRAVVFGSGGAARAVCQSLVNARADVMVVGRTLSHIRPLERAFGVRSAGMDKASEWSAKADLIVNATPLGMDGKSSPVPSKTRFKTGSLAYDLVYKPSQTPFLKQALAQGIRPLGGLAMLVGQAVATWKIWFNEDVPGDDSAAAKFFLEEHLKGE